MSPKRPPRNPSAKKSPPRIAAGDRLQKVMAAVGIGSRRDCEQLILAGRVDVDGRVITELGTRVDLSKQVVRFDGEPLKPRRLHYYVLNKPTNVVCTNRDPQRRVRVIDLIPGEKHVFTVGRLDKSSEGLILVTNDGELANRLAHPRYEIDKVYRVTVVGRPDPKELARLRKGLWFAEGKVQAADLKIKARRKNTTELEMVLKEGRNREIRRMLARIGHKVVALRRVAMGPIRLGELPVGAHRELTPQELRNLRKLAFGGAPKKKPRRSKSARRGTGGPRPGGSKPVGKAKRAQPKAEVDRQGTPTATKSSTPAKRRAARRPLRAK